MRAPVHATQRTLLAAFAAAVLCLALVVPLVPQQTASAQATIIVTSGANDGPGSLREAVNSANNGDIITFADSVGRIDLTQQITINKSLMIEGSDTSDLAITSDGSNRIFYVGNDADTEVTISGVTITGGSAANGGAIYLHTSTLTITNSIIALNTTGLVNGNVSGGAIMNAYGTLTIVDSIIAQNTVTAGISQEDGGGIANLEGSVTIIDSIIANNTSQGSGGGIYNSSGTIDIIDSIIANNISQDGDGGGIYSSAGTVDIIDSIIAGNDAEFGDGGGIYNSSGTVDITTSIIADNTSYTGGGGIANDQGTVTINASTISENQTDPNFPNGGGINNVGGILDITSSTISGNSTGIAGGGIFSVNTSDSTSEVTITSSTITANTANIGAGINIEGGSAEIENSIIAGNLTSGDCAIGSSDPLSSLGHNIDGDNTCGFTEDTDLPGTDPQLASLGNYGGTTLTHAIDENSPAYNAGGAGPCATTHDQRGAPRPQGGACDIGAFEVGIIIGAPALTLPEDMTVEATGSDGAVVTFNARATDGNDELIDDVDCDPSSGSTFSIGTTVVECSATDTAGQTVTGTFTITVIGQDALLSQLIQDTRGGAIPAFLKPRLLAFLHTADRALDQGQTGTACSMLAQFSTQVETLSPGYISPALAEQLSNDALAIRDALGC